MTRTMTAEEKRYQAMRDLFDTCYDREQNVWVKYPDQETADQIRALKALGRTERWQNAVERWAKMVEEDAGRNSTFGFIQGSVYANFAAGKL